MKHSLFALSCWLLAPAAFAILDTNNNGLSDFWERDFNNGSLFDELFDPQGDADSDGWTNAQEAEAGTNPFDPNPPDGMIRPIAAHVPAVWSEPDEFNEIYLISPEAVTVTWPTLAGKQYTLYFSPDLTQGSWLPVGDPFIAYGGEATYGFEISQSDKCFWRVTATDVDSDYDGLSNYEEISAGTNPYGMDSDGDTISDWQEFTSGTNPLNQDTDGDGIPDPIDSEPLVSSFGFADADGDGIPDADDAAPNDPRGPAPFIASENASGNPLSNLTKDEAVKFVFMVSNPAGSAPTASNLAFFLNGTEETATITAIGSPIGSSQRFLLTWAAKTTANYPTLTIQNLTLRFRDSAQATSWLNLARIDVAEWEGKIITLPFVSSEDSWGYDVITHLNGMKVNQHFVARNSGANMLYRGPKTMKVINSNGGTSDLQLPDLAIPYLKISGSPGSPPTVVEQQDYATLATGMDVDYVFNNGSAKSLKFELGDAGINATLSPGQANFDSVSLVNAALPFGTSALISYLDGADWKPFYSSYWPVANIAGANSRILRSVNVLTNAAGQLKLHAVTNYMGRDAKITPHASGTLEYPGLPQESVTSEYDQKYMALGSEEWRKIVVKIYPSQQHFTYSKGYRLNLGTGSTGNAAPQTGWLAQTKSGDTFTPLTIPADGKIEILATDTNLYPQLISSDGLVLFLKRDATVDQAHVLSLDVLPIAETNSADRISSLNIVPVMIKQRIPDIADDEGATNYEYVTVSSIPWGLPNPSVEIIEKTITGDQLVLSAEVYDALTDVAKGLNSLTPQLWVNGREVDPVPGDKNGVYRLLNHSYKLYPGRNEVTVCVRNSLGVDAHHTVVIEGDSQQGYAVAEEPSKVPEHPSYPVVCEINGLDFSEDQKITLSLAGKSVEVGKEQDGEQTDNGAFRSEPFISLDKPESASPDQTGAIPSDKPIFLAELDENSDFQLELPGSALPLRWSARQSGFELVSPKRVEIKETDESGEDIRIKARGLGESPSVIAVLTTYKNDESVQDLTASFTSAYQSAYAALNEGEESKSFSFTLDEVEFKEGYNFLAINFTSGTGPRHSDSYHCFRYPSPTQAGVRVFSANRAMDSVLEGVSGRMGDIWYPVDSDADLAELAKAIATSGCKIVGMTDLNGCFDDVPLKRSFLVRGPPGNTFQAFDALYAAQDREQRSQTFDADGTNGASLAGELNRVQTDDDLPASARNALALETAQTYQLHNGFEDFVPKTHQPYVDPGTGTQQPNSWTMRGSSLPDHSQSNPGPWTVSNTLSDPDRAASVSGIIKLNTTGEDTAYYATTPASAPWDLSGARAVSLRFKLLEHDAANGADGAFQLAAGDGSRIWSCQVAPAQIKVQATTITLPAATFPSGLIDGKFHTLQFNFSGTGNDALVSIDGEVLTTTATAQTGTLNGIAFGDPGAGIAGKIEVDTLQFENSDLRYQYGYIADDYADSDEIDGSNNILLYLRSKGQVYQNSAIASWVNLLDQNVNEWLLGKYTGQNKLYGQQELYVYAQSDVWLGSIVDMDVNEEVEGIIFRKTTKTTRCLNLDKEETKFFSTDQTRNEMQLAGLLMAWVYQQNEYKEWLAEKEGGGTGIDGLLLHKKHCVENIAKCAKHVETTLSVGGEIAVSMTNEYVDYAITINNVRQGDYMAMVGFIPLVPSSTARAFKFINKIDGTLIEGLDRLCKKFPDFPTGKVLNHVDDNGITRNLEIVNLFADHTDSVAVGKMRKIANNEQMSTNGPGSLGGHELLSTFSNQAVICYKTKEPTKAYRVFDSTAGRKESNFLLLEPPISKAQAEADYALGANGVSFQPNYDSWIEIEIPQDSYVFTGVAGTMNGKYVGGGRQVWIEDDVVNGAGIDWAGAVVNSLPQN